MSRASVRTRLAVWYGGILAGTLLLLGTLAYVILDQGLRRDVDHSLLAVARAVGDWVTRREVSPRPTSIEDLVRDLFGASPVDRYFQLLDPAGQPLAMSPDIRGLRLPPSEEALHNAAVGLPTYETVTLGERPVRLLTFPVIERGRTARLVRVAMSLEGVDSALRKFLLAAAALFPVATLLAATGGYLLARRALRPVDRMTQAARLIEVASLSDRITDPGTEDELGRLARTLNDMLDRLEGAFAEVRRFTADASHELRTPLTILKGEIEVALRTPREPAEYRKILESCLEEADRMARMVQNLLTLSRADVGQLGLERHPVDLGELLARVVTRARPLGEARGVTVALAEGPAGAVLADAERLEQAFFNLVDNGVKYTPPGGRVTVRWRRTPPEAPSSSPLPPALPLEEDGAAAPPAGRVEVEVQDTGIGIAATDCDQIFRRFFRVDRARSRAEGGSGLGLAIVKSIVEAHGGTVRMESALGHGSTFTVALPLGDG